MNTNVKYLTKNQYKRRMITMEKTSKLPNRWLIAIASIIMQICLGTVYGWSVFTKPLEAAHGWNRTEVTLAFTFAIGFLGLAAALGGALVDKKGPRLVAVIGGILFGFGTIFTGLAEQYGLLWLIYITYGVIGGIGLGFAYITPISVLVKWFPDKRGLITGLAVMGFGFGAFFMTVFSPKLISAIGISTTFYILGLIFLVLVTLSACLFINPPAGYKPEGWEPKPGAAGVSGVKLTEALKMKQFWLFWVILFLNVSAGIALISQASPMVQENYKQTAAAAGILIGIFSIFNGLGRLFWSSISDYIGRRNVFLIFFASQAVIFLILPHIGSLAIFVILACYIYACYGGGFSTMPAFAADTFGAGYVGTIYGWILTAWSAAAIVGPIMYSKIRELTHGYSQALTVTGCTLIIALVFPLLAGKKKN